MSGDVGLADAAGIGAGRVQESASGASSSIDNRLGKVQKVVTVIEIFVPYHFDQPGPAVANADDAVTFAQGAERDRPDGGVQTGDITASGEDADDALLSIDVGHGGTLFY